MTDMLIRGGTVIDGTGAKSYAADARIADGRITEIGAGLTAAAGEEVVDDAEFEALSLSRHDLSGHHRHLHAQDRAGKS